MTNVLFVYGTLMPTACDRLGHTARERLSSSGAWRGAASLQGILYDLGGYPGLVETADHATAVSGAVIELRDPAHVFLWLDIYEGIDPQRPETSEYKRVVRHVSHGHAGLLAAWVYIYIRSPDPAKRIAGCSWLKHIK